ncbi:Rossmann-like and DUF2520 domain-containing protein [Lentiprolixibacter aurantiacus]|uniref:DUF2520 domain-containing protein n=1 Tax=Lentiprolixibacter aurantiacus TaxID=2993939 RepID=A0AAE3MLX3_9FLAO|nr:DUF2520 domain-containing protein [Lentiprolixibacter aurantiacus]MCX2719781.1 DUF2520 domain-containing protein [Lentiprolixibacter aurantiacus]
MLKIVLLGTGNLAVHLFDALATNKFATVIQVFGRNKEALSYFQDRTDITDSKDNIRDADLYICAVSDDAIKAVSQYPRHKEAIILHCSGAVPLTALPGDCKRGVFYPLQTFSKGRSIDFTKVPICVEAENNEVLEVLLALGKSISETCVAIDSDQRKALHLAAVFANNFTNHLFERAAAICADNKLPFNLLKPLIEETVAKLDTLSPLEAQTGPARRGDQYTQEKHLNLMTDLRDREIYRILSQAIEEKYGNQL